MLPLPCHTHAADRTPRIRIRIPHQRYCRHKTNPEVTHLLVWSRPSGQRPEELRPSERSAATDTIRKSTRETSSRRRTVLRTKGVLRLARFQARDRHTGV